MKPSTTVSTPGGPKTGSGQVLTCCPAEGRELPEAVYVIGVEMREQNRVDGAGLESHTRQVSGTV